MSVLSVSLNSMARNNCIKLMFYTSCVPPPHPISLELESINAVGYWIGICFALSDVVFFSKKKVYSIVSIHLEQAKHVDCSIVIDLYCALCLYFGFFFIVLCFDLYFNIHGGYSL